MGLRDGALDDEDEDGEDDEVDDMTGVENLRYEDFWEAPKQLYGRPGSGSKKGGDSAKPAANGHGQGQGKGKGKNAKGQGGREAVFEASSSSHKAKPAMAIAAATVTASPSAAKKRRVSFHDEVKVQEYQPAVTRKTAI